LNKFDVILIGSGLGSLLCGYILSKEGMHVCILEKNRVYGGSLQTFKRKGVAFDTGIHYMGGLSKGQNLHQYFRYFGLIDKLRIHQLNKDRFDVIGFGDEEYPLAQGFDNFIEQLLPHFPNEKESLQRYIRMLKAVADSFPLYNIELPGKHNEDIYRNQSAFDFYNTFQYPASSIQQPCLTGRQATSGIPLSAILTGNSFLYDGKKNKTPLYIPALINHSFISSSWRPVEGSQQMADLLVDSIKQAGGTLFTQKEVSGIRYAENLFQLKTESGEQFTSEYLISGIHPATMLQMMEPSKLRTSYTIRINSLANTSGAFTLYIVLKKASFKYLDYNYYYHTSKELWTEQSGRPWPESYMLLTPDSEETGKFAKSMVIMTTMDFNDLRKWETSFTGQRRSDYAEFKGNKAMLLLDLVEKRFPLLRSKIDYLEISTPLTWRDYTGTPEGSMYGIQKDFSRSVETTILPKTKIPKLLFTGQNINLHGVLGVTAGAVMTCGEIIGTENLINKIRNA
jgi:all-trans-retinol 13,14-reductase